MVYNNQIILISYNFFNIYSFNGKLKIIIHLNIVKKIAIFVYNVTIVKFMKIIQS